MFRSDCTGFWHPSQTHVESKGDMASTGDVLVIGEVIFESVPRLLRPYRVGVRRKAARVGVGEHRFESGTGDNRGFLGWILADRGAGVGGIVIGTAVGVGP